MRMLNCENCNGELNPYIGTLSDVIVCEYCGTPHQLESQIAQYINIGDNNFLIWLRNTMIDCFVEDDLRFICDDIYAMTKQMDYEDVAGRNRSAKVLEIIQYARRRGLIPMLVEAGMRRSRDFALKVDYYEYYH